jgi:hypothetical protein
MRHLSAFLSGFLLISVGLLTACGSDRPSAPATTAAPPAAPVVTSQPANQTVNTGQTATFAVVATGTALAYQWERNGAAITGAQSASYTTAATTTSDNAAAFSVVITNPGGSVTSTTAKLTVATPGTDVVTYKYDAGRTGQNIAETMLTPANVNMSSFGLRRLLFVDGKVDAQPLYLSQFVINNTVHNVVIAATEHDSVYAFDADTGTVLWHVSLIATGETLSDTHGCTQVTPEIGVTSTPVIDRKAGLIYVVAMTKDGVGNYHQRLHALMLTTGAEALKAPVEITATYPNAAGPNGAMFNPGQYEERAALLLANGTIYTSWTSHCDFAPYSGWIIAFDASTLASGAILNVAPNSEAGPSIWMSGGGPSVDAAGNVYLLTANGAFETTLNANGFPNAQDFGNSFVKLATTGGTLAVADYFTMSNEVAESAADVDLGSGGSILLPDMTDATKAVKHLIIGAGKDGNIYLVDRDSMGKFSPSANNIWQQLSNVTPGGLWSTPAYFNGRVYFGDVSGTLKAFTFSAAKLSSGPTSQSTTQYIYPGTSPSVSANGIANGIVWAHENSVPAVLHAYAAEDLSHELYNSNQAPNGRDQFGPGNKFIAPAVADGKVFFGTPNAVAVFGLLK